MKWFLTLCFLVFFVVLLPMVYSQKDDVGNVFERSCGRVVGGVRSCTVSVSSYEKFKSVNGVWSEIDTVGKTEWGSSGFNTSYSLNGVGYSVVQDPYAIITILGVDTKVSLANLTARLGGSANTSTRNFGVLKSAFNISNINRLFYKVGVKELGFDLKSSSRFSLRDGVYVLPEGVVLNFREIEQVVNASLVQNASSVTIPLSNFSWDSKENFFDPSTDFGSVGDADVGNNTLTFVRDSTDTFLEVGRNKVVLEIAIVFRSTICFDLTPSIPATVINVTHANLTVFVQRKGNETNNIHRVRKMERNLTQWSDASGNCGGGSDNNCHLYTDMSNGTQYNQSTLQSTGFHEYNITPASSHMLDAVNFLNGSFCVGLFSAPGEEGSKPAQLSSRLSSSENANATRRPKLLLDYTESVVEGGGVVKRGGVVQFFGDQSLEESDKGGFVRVESKSRLEGWFLEFLRGVLGGVW